MDIMMINNLAKIRKSKGQTQQEVADFLNVKRSAYGHWESGKRPMTVISALHLMNYWEVEFSDLFEIESKDCEELFISKCIFWKG
jgi:transcriptional regulator with XRE-family HTH domain